MKNLQQLASPLSYFILIAAGYLIFVIPLQPSLLEFLLFVAVDIAALIVGKFIANKIFFRLYPEVNLYFYGIRDEDVRNLTLPGKRALFDSIVAYPMRRAWYVTFASIFKLMPAFIVIGWFWSHGLNPWTSIAIVSLAAAIILLYFYVIVYIESHLCVSQLIREIHSKHDWTDVFLDVGDSLPMDTFQRLERAVLAMIWIFVLGTQWMILQAKLAIPKLSAPVSALLIGLVGMILISRVLYVSRKFFFNGMKGIFDTFALYQPNQHLPEILPLHSSGMLARFENTFNGLSVRLRSYEVELSRWVMRQTDESRFRALGEISALVAHDLSTPLHVIGFCAEHFAANKDKLVEPKYLNQLSTQVERAQELVDTLKSYLRGKMNQPGSTKFDDAYDAVIRLIKTQFLDKGVEKVSFECDPALHGKILGLPKPDLIHVLLNLYANATESLLSTGVATPRIKVECIRADQDGVLIRCMDNGKGLSPEQFEEMTAFDYRSQKKSDTPLSLGLRLIRRLLERGGGSIKVVPPAENWSSIFEISIKNQTSSGDRMNVSI